MEFVNLYNADSEKDKELFWEDVQEGLGRSKKEIPNKYLYDEEGSKLWAEVTRTQEYYISNSEAQMLRNNASKLLQACGENKFNLIDLGDGDGTKTKIILEKAV